MHGRAVPLLPCLLITIALAGAPGQAATYGSKGAAITLRAKWEGTPLLLEAFEFVVGFLTSCMCIEPDVLTRRMLLIYVVLDAERASRSKRDEIMPVVIRPSAYAGG